MSSSTTTHCRHQIYPLWPSSGDHFPAASPDDLIPIELHFMEINGSSSTHKIKHKVTKKFTSIPLRALSGNEEHLESMTRCLSDLGVPEQTHSVIVADTCRLVNAIVAECGVTPPVIVVNASAFTWTMRVLEADDDPVLPDSMEDLGFLCF